MFSLTPVKSSNVDLIASRFLKYPAGIKPTVISDPSACLQFIFAPYAAANASEEKVNIEGKEEIANPVNTD